MLDKSQLRQAAVKSLYRSVKIANHDVAKTRLIKIASGIAAGKTISEAVASAGITGDTATVLTARIAKMAMRDAVGSEKKAGPFRRMANNIRNRRAARQAPPAQSVAPRQSLAPAAAPVASNAAAPAAKSVAPVATPTDKSVTPTGNSYDAAFDAAFNTGRESGPTQVSSSPLVELGSQARQAVNSGSSNTGTAPTSYSAIANMSAKSLQQAAPPQFSQSDLDLLSDIEANPNVAAFHHAPQRPANRIINQTPSQLPQPIQRAMDFASALPTELRQAYGSLMPSLPNRLPTPEQVRYGRINRFSTSAPTPAAATTPAAPAAAPTQIGNGRTTMTR